MRHLNLKHFGYTHKIFKTHCDESMTLSEHSLLTLMLSTMLIQNIILGHFLGLCPFIGVSSHKKNAIGMAGATTAVLILVSMLSYWIHTLILVPFELTYLKTVTLIFVIASSVQCLELLIRSISPLLHKTLGIYLPLMTSNCAVLGVGLLAIQHDFNSWKEALAFGTGAGIGFALILLILSDLRHRISMHDVPKPFQGTAIGLITASIMSLAFMGFKGL